MSFAVGNVFAEFSSHDMMFQMSASVFFCPIYREKIPCCLVGWYQCFRRTSCLRFQGVSGISGWRWSSMSLQIIGEHMPDCIRYHNPEEHSMNVISNLIRYFLFWIFVKVHIYNVFRIEMFKNIYFCLNFVSLKVIFIDVCEQLFAVFPKHIYSFKNSWSLLHYMLTNTNFRFEVNERKAWR